METIKSSSEISNLFSHGRRLNSSNLTLIIRNRMQHDQPGRVAFIAGKKLGNAVWRNQAKRRMRAILADIGDPWSGYDVIFIAKSRINHVSYSKVLNECSELLTKALNDA